MAVILPDVPFVFKFIMKGSISGHQFVNTWYAQHSQASFDQATMNTIATAAASAYWTAFAASLNTGTSHVLTTAIDLSSRQAGFGTDSTAHAGTITGVNVPTVQVACCISEIIQDRYRGGHPRFYLPAASMGDITGGNAWTTTALQRYKDAAVAFRSGINAMTAGASSWKLVAVRYYSDKILLTQPLVRDVTGTTVHTRVDSMRRRLGKEPT